VSATTRTFEQSSAKKCFAFEDELIKFLKKIHTQGSQKYKKKYF
jgi:hypothetical protein